MVYQGWLFNWDECHDRILHDPIQFRDCKNFNGLEIKGEFLRTPSSLDWAAMLAPIRSPLESPS